MSAPAEPSALSGLHVRAGNSMARTRSGLLDGALSVVERDGLNRLTMSSVANRSGVAKATLYNHFRTKEDVVRGLVQREVELAADDADRAAERVRASGADPVTCIAAGLAQAAATAAEHVAGRRVVAEDPGALAALLTCDSGPTWTLALERLGRLLGLAPSDEVVRMSAGWVVGQLFDPQDAQVQARGALVLARAAVQAGPGPGPG